MGMIVEGHRNVLTQGTYMGEEGTGYGFGPLSRYGDYSHATRGCLQGYTEPCRIEILHPEGELVDLSEEGYGVVLSLPKGTTIQTDAGPLLVDDGLSANQAIVLGLARVLPREETP